MEIIFFIIKKASITKAFLSSSMKNKIHNEEFQNSCIITHYLGQKELLEEYLIDNRLEIEVSYIDPLHIFQ